MANGGEVIFKFTGDDKDLKKVMNGLGGAVKGILKGLAVGTTAVAGAVRRSSSTEC